MRLTIVFVVAGSVLAGGPALAADTDGLSIKMAGNHAKPIAGEEQIYELSLRNDGQRAVTGAWVAVKLPADWTVEAPKRCHPEDDRLVCGLGALASDEQKKVAITATVAKRPRLGRVTISALSGAHTPDGPFSGPSTSLTVEVVRDRW